MPIDTLRDWYPKLQLPLYTRITTPEQNSYEVGGKYDMRVEDRERQEELGGRGPYTYPHEALLVAREEMKLEDIPDELLGFDTHNTSKKEAVREVFPADFYKGAYEREMVILIFLRLDATRDWVLGEFDTIDPENSIEAYEGNG